MMGETQTSPQPFCIFLVTSMNAGQKPLSIERALENAGRTARLLPDPLSRGKGRRSPSTLRLARPLTAHASVSSPVRRFSVHPSSIHRHGFLSPGTAEERRQSRVSLLCRTWWMAGEISHACGSQTVRESRPHHVPRRRRTRFQRRFSENNFKGPH